MLRLFWPSRHNNFQPHLLRTSGFAFLAVLVALTNFALPIPAFAATSIDVEDLLTAHNQERTKLGLPPLRLNAALTNSAQRKANAMLENDCWSHYCPANKTPWAFFAEAGYDYRFAGENLAEGFSAVENVMVAWMNSPTHRENIIKAEYEEIGFGMVIGKFQGREDNLIIAVHFGTSQPSSVDVERNPHNPLALTKPSIESPTPGTYINTPTAEIKGTAPDATQVVLFNRDREWITTDANQGVFTYRAENLTDDFYQISAQSRIGSRVSDKSKTVQFIVDTTPNQIQAEQITTVKGSAEGKISLQVNSPNTKTITMHIGPNNYRLLADSAQIWEIEVAEALLKAAPEISFETEDLAGNTWVGGVGSGSVLAQMQKLQHSEPIITGITRSNINLVFLTLLTVLMSIDFTVLRKTGMTKIKSKGQLHLGVILMLVVILAIGHTSGQILDGLGN